jgi:hypothetical protein
MATAKGERLNRAASMRWLLLVILAWSQFAFAAHQFTHDADELATDCAVCLRADCAQIASPDLASSYWVSPYLPAANADSHAPTLVEPFRLYRSRASP